MHWLDPSVLPAVKGHLTQYTLNAHGDIDGFLLEDDRQIHVPPHMGAAVARLVGIGDAVEARYVKPRDAAVFAAVSISNQKGKTISDAGPPHKHGHKGRHPEAPPPRTKPMHIVDRVRMTLYAPKGEVCGAILDRGVQVRLDPKANADLAAYFAKDAQIAVWGDALTRKGVTVVDVKEIAFDVA